MFDLQFSFFPFTEITVCAPNPCKNSGECITVNQTDFKCDCTGTGYGGVRCDVGIIKTPVYPTLLTNITYNNLVIAAKPSNEITISLSTDNNVKLSTEVLQIRHPDNKASFSLRAVTSGLHIIKYQVNGTDAESFENPNADVVFAVGQKYGDEESMSMVNDQGQLIPGCHEFKVSPPNGNSNFDNGINIVSTAPWNTNENMNTGWTEGVTEMAVEGHYLPVSLAGSSINSNRLRANDYSIFIENYNTNNNYTTAATPTNSTPTVTTVRTCADQRPSAAYLDQFVSFNIFLQTVADFFNSKTPYWVGLSTDPLSSHFRISDFMANVYSGQQMKIIYPKCSSLLQVNNGNSYYVYSTTQNIRLHSSSIDNKIEFGQEKCIVQSINENSLHVVLPEQSNLNTESILPLGFNGRLSSVGFGVKDNNTVFSNGIFTTEMTSSKGNVTLIVTGNMKWTVNDTNQVRALVKHLSWNSFPFLPS